MDDGTKEIKHTSRSHGGKKTLKPAGEFVETGERVNFYTLVESAAHRGQVAIGYHLAQDAGEAGKSYGIHANPKKSALLTFSPEDKIIVLAEL